MTTQARKQSSTPRKPVRTLTNWPSAPQSAGPRLDFQGHHLRLRRRQPRRFCGPDVELYTLIDELARKAARLASYDNTDTLALEDAVFLAACVNAEQLAADGLLTASDDWSSTGTPANGSRAQALYPNFADPTALGEWEGFDLESVQKACQDVMNAAFALCEDYENRETK